MMNSSLERKKTFTFGFCCQLWLGVCVKPESQRWVRQTHQDHLSPRVQIQRPGWIGAIGHIQPPFHPKKKYQRLQEEIC